MAGCLTDTYCRLQPRIAHRSVVVTSKGVVESVMQGPGVFRVT